MHVFRSCGSVSGIFQQLVTEPDAAVWRHTHHPLPTFPSVIIRLETKRQDTQLDAGAMNIALAEVLGAK